MIQTDEHTFPSPPRSFVPAKQGCRVRFRQLADLRQTPARIAFHFEQEPVKDVLHVAGLTLRAGGAAGGRILCQTVDFDLMRGEKIAIVGRNGVGKSTFLKALLGRLKPEAGSIRWGRNVKVSYFEQ